MAGSCALPQPQGGRDLAYDNGYARLPPDELCAQQGAQRISQVKRQKRQTYFHIPAHYIHYATGKGLTAAALILLLEAHRRVAIKFGDLPLTSHTAMQLGLTAREMRTARMQLQRHRCEQWRVAADGIRRSYKLSVDPDKWTDRSESGDTSVS